ncbi:MAG: 4'-phosphopantetheinyl transferase superfamily protein [Bacteroidales bacterium]
MIKAFVVKLRDDEFSAEYQDTLLQYLPEAGRKRVSNRQNLTSKLHTVAGELLARYSVGQYLGHAKPEIELEFGEKGKPRIANLINVHFNISHSGNYVVCAVSGQELGIDVERVRKVNLRIAERFFSQPEIDDLMALEEDERMQYFITLWTIKESYLKAIGRGLTQHLNSFTIRKNGNAYLLTGNQEAEGYGIEAFSIAPDYSLAICSPLPFSPAEITTLTLKDITLSLPVYPESH